MEYPLRIEVAEQQPGGRKVIGYIKACDDDDHPNNIIYYHIVPCELFGVVLSLFLMRCFAHAFWN